MGCSGSKVARGDVEMSALPARAPERRHSLPARAASALGSLSFCRGRHDGVHAYTTLPLDEQTLKRGVNDGATASLGGKRGIMAVLEGAASATSSTVYWPASATLSTAQWPSESRGEPSSLTPVQVAPPVFDPLILSMFRQTMSGPSPSHPALLFPEKEAATAVEEPFSRDIQEVTPEFHEKEVVTEELEAAEEDVRDYVEDVAVVAQTPAAARARDAVVVVYFTSLRGVRKTFEDGRDVHSILGFYGVRVDERDVSMHAAFKEELWGLLDGVLALPRVFVASRRLQEQWRDLGGLEDVRALHDAGELVRALEDCEPLGRDIAPCDGCGDMRFLPCNACYGSCRVFTEDEVDGYLVGVFQDCHDYNENGLIRCPDCCY